MSRVAVLWNNNNDVNVVIISRWTRNWEKRREESYWYIITVKVELNTSENSESYILLTSRAYFDFNFRRSTKIAILKDHHWYQVVPCFWISTHHERSWRFVDSSIFFLNRLSTNYTINVTFFTYFEHTCMMYIFNEFRHHYLNTINGTISV